MSAFSSSYACARGQDEGDDADYTAASSFGLCIVSKSDVWQHGQAQKMYARAHSIVRVFARRFNISCP